MKGIIEMGNWEEKTIRVKLESFERIQMGGEVLVFHADAKNTIHNSDYEATLRVINEFKDIGNGSTLSEYCQERINSAEPNGT